LSRSETNERECNAAAALGSADKVVVEGDDRLLSYAVSKASGDPENRIAVEIGDDRPAPSAKAEQGGEITVTIPNPPARTNLRRILLIVVPLLAFLVLGGISVWIFFSGEDSPEPFPERHNELQLQEMVERLEERARTQQASDDELQELRELEELVQLKERARTQQASDDDRIELERLTRRERFRQLDRWWCGRSPQLCISDKSSHVVPASPAVREAERDRPKSQPSDTPVNHILAIVQMLVWPTVAALAIIALFLIAWKAITRGQNIEISWKVTEKITGRVVITKVKTRAAPAKRRAAAA
jgi:hypothetical protein